MCQHTIDTKKFEIRDDLVIKVESFYESGSRLTYTHVYTHMYTILYS